MGIGAVSRMNRQSSEQIDCETVVFFFFFFFFFFAGSLAMARTAESIGNLDTRVFENLPYFLLVEN